MLQEKSYVLTEVDLRIRKVLQRAVDVYVYIYDVFDELMDK